MPKFNFCHCVNPSCPAKYHKICDPDLRKMIYRENEIAKFRDKSILALLKNKDVDAVIDSIVKLV